MEYKNVDTIIESLKGSSCLATGAVYLGIPVKGIVVTECPDRGTEFSLEINWEELDKETKNAGLAFKVKLLDKLSAVFNSRLNYDDPAAKKWFEGMDEVRKAYFAAQKSKSSYSESQPAAPSGKTEKTRTRVVPVEKAA